jgi:hypothetical protein
MSRVTLFLQAVLNGPDAIPYTDGTNFRNVIRRVLGDALPLVVTRARYMDFDTVFRDRLRPDRVCICFDA